MDNNGTDKDWCEDFQYGGYKNDVINNFKPKKIKMKKNIITAVEAREISEVNKSVGFNSIMSTVEEYAAQGKKEFEVRNKPLFKQWETELVGLGYTLTKKENAIWVLSWDNAKSSRFSHLPKKDTPTYIDLRLMRNALTGLTETEIQY